MKKILLAAAIFTIALVLCGTAVADIKILGGKLKRVYRVETEDDNLFIPEYGNLNFSQKVTHPAKNLYLVTVEVDASSFPCNVPYPDGFPGVEAGTGREKKGSELLKSCSLSIKNSSPDIASVLINLIGWLSENFTYDSKTFSGKPLDEIINYGSGNCVDYSNITLEILSELGIEARTKSGFYAFGRDETEGVEKRGGEYGNHAFVEACLPGRGWFFFDPQNTVNFVFPGIIYMGDINFGSFSRSDIVAKTVFNNYNTKITMVENIDESLVERVIAYGSDQEIFFAGGADYGYKMRFSEIKGLVSGTGVSSESGIELIKWRGRNGKIYKTYSGGRYAVPVNFPGIYFLEARAPGAMNSGKLPVTTFYGLDNILDITLQAGYSVSGRLIAADPAGLPPDFSICRLDGDFIEEYRPDTGLGYSVTGLSSGLYTFGIKAGGFVSCIREISVDTDMIMDFEVPGMSLVSGRILDKNGNIPVDRVEIIPSSEKKIMTVSPVYTDTAGYFTLGWLPGGEYDLSMKKNDKLIYKENLLFSPGRMSLGDFKAGDWWYYYGKIVKQDTLPFSDFRIFARDGGNYKTYFVTGEGEFYIEGIENKPRVLGVLYKNGFVAERQATAREYVVFDFRKVYPLEVTVERKCRDREYSLSIEKDGEYIPVYFERKTPLQMSLPYIDSGKYTVCLTSDSVVFARKDVLVNKPGRIVFQDNSVNIDVQPVMPEAKAGRGSLQILVKRAGDREYTSYGLEEGRRRLYNIKPGKYELMLVSCGYPVWTDDLTAAECENRLLAPDLSKTGSAEIYFEAPLANPLINFVLEFEGKKNIIDKKSNPVKINCLGPGDYRIYAVDNGRVKGEAAFSMTPGAAEKITLR